MVLNTAILEIYEGVFRWKKDEGGTLAIYMESKGH